MPCPETEKESLELTSIEAGAEDVRWNQQVLEVYTKPEDLEKVKKVLEEKQIKIDHSSLAWLAKEEITLDEKGRAANHRLFEALDENDAIQNVYSNLRD